jgi:ABC-type multidrug transport system ATPase subunit
MTASNQKKILLYPDISVKQLGKRFNREWIFRNFDYDFLHGNTYAIIGPNGSGKSTLLQVLWGQLPPTNGELHYKDQQTEIPIDEIFHHIAIATPYLDLIEEFTLAEHLRFHFKLKASRNGMNEQELLDKMELTHAKDKNISDFSSGMRQRVKLALAFFTQASLIFLDEPTTNLDQQAGLWYHTQLNDLPKDCSLFIASNVVDEYPSHAHLINILDYKKAPVKSNPDA